MNTTCTHETHYPTDTTDAEWTLIAPYVGPDPPIGSPRDVCMCCVVNALFYWGTMGCQWKMLPTNLPNYCTVSHHFRRWSADGTLERIAHDLQRAVRRDAGRNPDPSRGSVDSQSAQPPRRVVSAILMLPNRSTAANASSLRIRSACC